MLPQPLTLRTLILLAPLSCVPLVCTIVRVCTVAPRHVVKVMVLLLQAPRELATRGALVPLRALAMERLPTALAVGILRALGRIAGRLWFGVIGRWWQVVGGGGSGGWPGGGSSSQR